MKKILIVDDDADLRDVIKTVLSGRYEYLEAADTSSASKAFSAFEPDLVMLDVMMDTKSSGFELAREFKGSTKAAKILMLTSVDKETGIDFASEAGDQAWLPVDDYLSKPVVPKTLLEKVQSMIG